MKSQISPNQSELSKNHRPMGDREPLKTVDEGRKKTLARKDIVVLVE